MPSQLVLDNFRVNKLPHIWCPGCGHGILMRAITVAIDELGLDKDKVCIVSGIGCSSRAAGYMDFSTLHTTHGRAIAFATGLKMANPELHVIVITGDGDCSAIGGNHLIHASRRNIDITTVVFNNSIYGMTGGQFSPTTPQLDKGTTAPYGNIDKPFDICQLAKGAGATYVARSTAYHAKQMINYVKKGIQHKGFALVEGMSSCPTYYGRKNRKGSAVDMIMNLKDTYVDIKVKDKMTPEQLEGKLFMGEFHESVEPEYTQLYQEIIDRFK
ncbi:MAG: 2-oxoacid:ferredoxin oxidoreductase subunit beta [Proteocatella sp.]|nr:2-oxoacid:ferredoxin oxidoreductase subunit beta [Proteocatella sp.]MBP8654326.1 2-oxoacid:ferredoxin oxidoreductase subunit beta [Proteocatella sp.]MBP9658990.1 2-oxoacid:ferredoxin oxidoreductase subunit beta [Proteocatella sp.]MBP9966630.1 2-oxoacid:ferredoxin oxidoreductase subunit beta [Proteocatella sp.]NCB71136.1 2-oxoacid:ferredoxin oxidoreductase subunit beta [Clostridia bacterium]